ncbi:MAG: four helix bundle protein [bacterium]
MTTYKQFEDLPIWKEAEKMAVRVLSVVKEKSFRYQFELKNQIQRSAISLQVTLQRDLKEDQNKNLYIFYGSFLNKLG